MRQWSRRVSPFGGGGGDCCWGLGRLPFIYQSTLVLSDSGVSKKPFEGGVEGGGGMAHGVLYSILAVGLFWTRAGRGGEGGALRAQGAEELKRRHCGLAKLAGPLLGSIIESAWRME